MTTRQPARSKAGTPPPPSTTARAPDPARSPAPPGKSKAGTPPPAPYGIEPIPDQAPAASTSNTDRNTPEPELADPTPDRTFRKPVRGGAAIGGLIVGLFVWPVAVNWLRGGQAQAIGWFGAKFFNEPYGSGASTAGESAEPSTAGTPGGTAGETTGGSAAAALGGTASSTPLRQPGTAIT